MKVRNCTTGELFSVPPPGFILTPKGGTVSHSLGGTVSNFIFALCFFVFSISGANCGIFKHKID